MFTTIIPIQGTFDIAKGRSSLRKQIARHSWPGTTTVRASAVLTALGDLIVPAGLEQSVPIQVEFAPDGPKSGIYVSCSLPQGGFSENQLAQTARMLRLTCDQLLIENTDTGIYIKACLSV